MKRFPPLMLAIMIGLVLLTTAACDSTDNTEADDILSVTDDGYTTINGANLSGVLNALPKEPLSAAEIAGLQFMREEEKLAHDVYTVLYENLMKGSRNHLRAFVRNLAQQGITYAPQYLDPAAYAAIINSPTERG